MTMKKEKIVICSSMSFSKEISEWKDKLEKENYELIKYPEKTDGEFLSGYKIEFSDHYQKITETDILFILNLNKNNIDGYIGAAVFAEIAFAIGLNRTCNKNIKVYCLNKFPDTLPYSEELKLWVDLGWLNFWK
jgi:hypothetical protein